MVNMKKSKIFIFSLVACSLLIGAWRFGYISGKNSSNEHLKDNGPNLTSDSINNESFSDFDNSRFYRNTNTIDFSGLNFTPWDVDEASSNINKRAKKPYTIMVYMNGSDLESEMGAATDDLIEMLKSGVNTNNVNIILFTGGANRWRNNVIPANNCVIWEAANGRLKKITGVGSVNMGDPGTLASFINFTTRNFPADKFGLIMWDHGGGSIAGFGDDEKFNHSYLTLLDMNYAFEKSAIAKDKLEFLGFDSCLMSTIEMAVVASDYAKYLVASEEIEPYDGWDYSFLSVLNDDPKMDGAALGKEIVNCFMDYYENDPDQILALSVIDLSKVDRVMGALGALMKQCSGSLLADREASFTTLATRRNRTKTFGVGSPRDNECDMVDIGDMANKLSNLFPNETSNILSELNNCVVYNRHNSDVNLKGLSVYYIYGGKENGNLSLDMYRSLNMNGDYTKYLNDFYRILKRDNTVYRGRSSSQGNQNDDTLPLDELISTELTLWQPVRGSQDIIMTGIQSCADMSTGEMIKVGMNSLWPTIGGKNVCLYKINGTSNSSLYAVPASINGEDCDIIVSFSEEYPHGKILGARKEDGLIIQKGYDDILEGDKISFYYSKRNQDKKDTNWYKDDEFSVKGNLKLEWSAPKGKSYYSMLLTDIQHTEYLTELKAIQ